LNPAAVFASHSTFCNACYYNYMNFYTFYMRPAIIIIVIGVIIIVVSCYGKLRIRCKVITQTQSSNVITDLQF